MLDLKRLSSLLRLLGGFIAPKGTPKAIVEKQSSEIFDIVKMPSVKRNLRNVAVKLGRWTQNNSESFRSPNM
ncbi:MAG: hypothetical protein CMM28_10470 [Rhodospirillaceae bacterium]|nr:hypothetical protein [Rhodospirillaceae bacterium]